MLEVIKEFKNNSFKMTSGEEKKLVIFNNGDQDIDYKLNIEVEDHVTLYVYNVVTSTKPAHIDEEITINGKNSKVEILNVLLVKDANLVSDLMIHHNAGESESNLASYAIAEDNAKVVLNNNATIKQGAHKSVVHQKAKGLNLAPTASITAQPNLFIDEYDVIANHAASVGSINKEDLFYLTSRGLTTEEASKLIVLGFIKPVIDNIDDEKLKDEIYNSFVSLL